MFGLFNHIGMSTKLLLSSLSSLVALLTVGIMGGMSLAIWTRNNAKPGLINSGFHREGILCLAVFS
ncbi:conserved protein of unknown function [Kyrpidia spormannii]|uniref:Uncharacterized protein n=2 Tax=Kyrpidia TaxID=1129704 RepID=A0A6F9E3C2_9BACL|nr:conserved protein of unknown function [Kyrpidia spormannii]